MTRGLLTLLTIVSFAVAYRVYARITAPLTQSRPAAAPPLNRDRGEIPTSRAARAAAELYLPDVDWVANPKITWQRGEQAFLYAQAYKPIDDELQNKVQFTPFALIWKHPDRPDAAPFVLSAEKARITFQRRFTDITGSDPGRIVGAALEGAVHVSGPDGLVLNGENFVFSEEQRTLYSDGPLQFGFGPSEKSPSQVRGSGRGVAILLTPGSGELLGDDLPRIADFENFTLRSEVRLEIEYEQDGELLPVAVASEGPMQFNRAQRLASFDRNVAITRVSGERDGVELSDTLNCQRLELWFEEAADPEGVRQASASATDVWNQKARSLANLQFRYLQATSPQLRPGEPISRVELQSDKYDLSLVTKDLLFDALKRQISITDPEASVIDYGLSRLLTRKLLIGLSEGQDIDLATSDGPGRIEHHDAETNALVFTAEWSGQMQFRPDPDSSPDPGLPDRVVELLGEVEVALGAEGVLTSDRLRLWIPEESMRSLADAGPSRPSGLPIRRVLAEGHVGFDSPQAHGKVGQLDLHLESGIPPEFTQPQRRSEPAAAGGSKSPGIEPRWSIYGQLLAVNLVVDPSIFKDPSALQPAPRSVTVEGNVRIERPAIPKGDGEQDGPYLFTGGRMVLANNGGSDQLLTLFGTPGKNGRTAEPAHVHSGPTHIEGLQIDVDRRKSLVKVHGRSLLQWPVDSDFLGRELPTPLLLNIECADGMTFDGQEAMFLKQVRVSLEESRLYCEELVARLDRKLDLQNPEPNVRPEIRDIECRDLVRIHMHEFKESQLVRYLEAKLGRFTVNLKSGDFSGKGPGDIDEWQKGGMRFNFAPEPSAEANRPAESTELPWTYVHLDFAGEAKGNLHQRFGTIHERVKAMYAPVDKVKTIFTQHDLSRRTASAERAACLRCDTLKVQLTDGDSSGRPFQASLEAEGKASLEGQSVHANAHQMSYEQAKGLLTLRGRGNEKASVYFESSNGTATDRFPFSGRTIECFPTSRKVKVDGAGTFSGSR